MDVRLIVSGIGFGRVEGAELIKMDPFYVPNVWGLLKNVWGLFKNISGLLKNVGDCQKMVWGLFEKRSSNRHILVSLLVLCS